MKSRLLNLMAALAIVFGANAQSLSVSDIETAAGWEETLTIDIEGASEMTALQCVLTLPEGIELAKDASANYGIELGSATDGNATNGHYVTASPLASGDLLIVVYSMDLRTFKNGTLLYIPVVATEDFTATASGKLRIVHTSTIEAESNVWSDVTFTAKLYGESEPTPEPEPYVTEFEANGIHYIFLEKYVSNDGLAAWVTSTNGWFAGEENSYSGDIVIPATVTYGGKEYPVMGICENAFKKCSINSLTLSEGVVYISPNAFEETHLGALYLPSTFRMWDNFFINEANGYMLLLGCLGLETLVVSPEHPLYDSRDNCNAIIETATNTLIEGCKGTVIPSSVTTIGPTAFIGRDIVEFVIPEGVKEVKGRVFERCKNLQSVVFPTSVEVIKGNMLFHGCSSLTSVEIPQTTLIRSAEDYEDPFETPGAMVIPSYMFSECSSLKEFAIPENVTSIGSAAFFMCGNLEAITIPESVIAIGDLAFNDCNKMTEITLLGQTPPAVSVDALAFNETQCEQITLNVPEGAEEAYKQHEVWGLFFTEPEPEAPKVESGEYYLYNVGEKKFLSRGEHWGTCATVDKYGIPFVWTAEEYSLKFLDSNVHLFETDDNNIYTDNASTGFAFEEVEGGYLLKSQKSDRYLTIVDKAHNHQIVNVTNDATAATLWQPMTKAEHDAIVAGYVEENYTNVIAAAGLTATAGDFINYLATLNAEDKTSAIGTARFAGSAGEWTFTELRHQDWQPAYGTDFCELWQATGYYTQTITGLAEGIYKVTMQGYERTGGWAECNALGAQGYEITTATLSANGEEVNLKSWYSGKTDESNPDNTGQAVAKFNEGKYMNELYTYVGEDGTLDLMVNIPSHVGGSWVLFNNFTLTHYAEGDATGIDMTTDNRQQTTVIYDLMGRKVESPAKGIYIVNGKKVVLK